MKPVAQIHDVIITPKKKIFDDRGGIFHMLRNDEPAFKKFGEIYFSQIYPGVIKAWHHHKLMTLNYLLISGSIRLVLFDDRPGSPTKGVFQEIYLHPEDSKLVTIPPGIWNGFKGVGPTASIVANCASEPHTKEEITYRPYQDFDYDWSQKNG